MRNSFATELVIILAFAGKVVAKDYQNWPTSSPENIAPQPQVRKYPFQGNSTSDIKPENELGSQEEQLPSLDKELSLTEKLADAERRAKDAAQRADAAYTLARARDELERSSRSTCKHDSENIKRLHLQKDLFQQRAERAEAVADELRVLLKSTETRIKKSEAAYRNLTFVKVALEAQIRKQHDEHTSYLRQQIIERDRVHREAREAGLEEAKTIIMEELTRNQSMIFQAGRFFASWSSAFVSAAGTLGLTDSLLAQTKHCFQVLRRDVASLLGSTVQISDHVNPQAQGMAVSLKKHSAAAFAELNLWWVTLCRKAEANRLFQQYLGTSGEWTSLLATALIAGAVGVVVSYFFGSPAPVGTFAREKPGSQPRAAVQETGSPVLRPETSSTASLDSKGSSSSATTEGPRNLDIRKRRRPKIQ